MKELEKRIRALAGDGPSEDLSVALARGADREGLLDVGYAEYDSPIGTLIVASTTTGLVRLALAGEDPDAVLDGLARDVSPRILRAPKRVDGTRRELDEYFAGRRQTFEVPLDWRLVRGFNAKVLHATAKIPFGAVSTYKNMATAAGSPRAARAAGNALHNNPIPIVVPCHRVVGSNGSLVGYGGGLDRKEFLLRLEGAIL
jgi:methylated-DNA-[protein]-cysteine S-methyltransferase